jgi:hypothetical protein
VDVTHVREQRERERVWDRSSKILERETLRDGSVCVRAPIFSKQYSSQALPNHYARGDALSYPKERRTDAIHECSYMGAQPHFLLLLNTYFQMFPIPTAKKARSLLALFPSLTTGADLNEQLQWVPPALSFTISCMVVFASAWPRPRKMTGRCRL